MLSYLGIDVGGSFIKYGILQQAEFVQKGSVATPKDGYTSFATELKEIVSEALSYPLKGIGICVPGKVNSDTGLVEYGGSLPYLHGKNLVAEIRKFTSLPVFVENDGKSATRAEAFSGNLKDIDQGAAIVLGTGVGSGYILNGQLRTGAHHQSGEVSFMVQDNKIRGLESFVAQQLSGVQLVHDLAAILGVEPDGPKVFELVTRDGKGMAHLRNYGKRVALFIFNLQTVLDVKRYVIGGGVSAQPLLIEVINEGFEQIRGIHPVISLTLTRPEIMAAKYREDANLLGVISYFLQEV